MTKSITGKLILFVIAIVSLLSCMVISASAASTSYKNIVAADYYASPQTNTYSINVGWFKTSKTVTIDKVAALRLHTINQNDTNQAARMARFDVTVTYKSGNTTKTNRYYGLKQGDTFKLTGKKWCESKTYTITVRSYFVNYSTDYYYSCFNGYRLTY